MIYNSLAQDTETTAAAYEIDFNFYGVNIMLFGCLMPFFLYHVASLKWKRRRFDIFKNGLKITSRRKISQNKKNLSSKLIFVYSTKQINPVFFKFPIPFYMLFFITYIVKVNYSFNGIRFIYFFQKFKFKKELCIGDF